MKGFGSPPGGRGAARRRLRCNFRCAEARLNQAPRRQPGRHRANSCRGIDASGGLKHQVPSRGSTGFRARNFHDGQGLSRGRQCSPAESLAHKTTSAAQDAYQREFKIFPEKLPSKYGVSLLRLSTKPGSLTCRPRDVCTFEGKKRKQPFKRIAARNKAGPPYY